MDIKVEVINDITVIELNGDLDSSSAREVQDQILAESRPHSKILLDMSRVQYMSSAGLRLLLLLYRRIREQVGQVAIVGMTEDVKDIMKITGFLDFFATFDDRSAGMSALQ